MKNNSFNTRHRYLNAVLNFHGIASSIAAIECLPEEDYGRRKVSFKEGELERILSKAEDREIRDGLPILRYSGMRVGTALRAPHEIINLRNEKIKIPCTLNKGKIHSYEIKIDGRIFNTIYHRISNAQSIAEEVLKDLKNKGFAIINDNLEIASKFLFPGVSIIGPDRYYQYFLQEFHAACHAANITDRRLHDLRRTFATDLYLKYHDLPAVSKALGHQSIYTTEIYLRLDPTDIRDLFMPVEHSYSQQELETIQFS